MRERPGATPLPLTFLGLAIATTVFAGLETRILPRADLHTVGWIVVAVPVPTQFLAAAWALVRGERAAATASSVLTATWLAVALTAITTPAGAASPAKAEGLLLFASAAAMLVAAATALAGANLVGAAVMLTTSCRFAITGISAFTATRSWATAAGTAGFILAGVALGAASILELRDAEDRA